MLSLPVLIFLLVGAMFFVRWLSPNTSNLVLSAWPSALWIGIQALTATFFKLDRDITLATVRDVGALQVSLSKPMGFNVKKFQRFMVITGMDRAGTGGQVPLTYPMAEAFRLYMQVLVLPTFPFGVLGSVLARNRTEMHRPVAMDEKLVYGVALDPASWRATPKADLEVDLVGTAASERDKSLVWMSRTTVILLNPKRARGGAPARPEQPAAQGGAAGAAQEECIDEWRLGGDAGRKYGLLTGDLNPIHLHGLFACMFGFKKPIAHALYLVARSEASLRAHGIQLQYPAVLTTEFKRPTLLPAKLKFMVAAGTKAGPLQPGAPGVQFTVKTQDGTKDVLVGKLYVAGKAAAG